MYPVHVLSESVEEDKLASKQQSQDKVGRGLSNETEILTEEGTEQKSVSDELFFFFNGKIIHCEPRKLSRDIQVRDFSHF